MRVAFLIFSLLVSLASAAKAELAGFLPVESLPDPLAFLSPPPGADSLAFAEDLRQYYLAKPLKGSGRWKRSAQDSEFQKRLPEFLSEALKIQATPKSAPKTFELFSRVNVDLGLAGEKIKAHYGRERPFLYFRLPPGSTCDPWERQLARNGSYPSGHAAIGFGLGLIVAGMFPDARNELIAGGLDYGYSRIVCGVHWASDVAAGQTMAAAVVASLYGSPEFLKAVAESKAELLGLRAARAKNR
jgi:acid phosphatase (class A)